MKTVLTYTHTRNIFIKNKWKPFFTKNFKDLRFEGCEYGNWKPKVSLTNWDEIKDLIPKSYKPIKVC